MWRIAPTQSLKLFQQESPQPSFWNSNTSQNRFPELSGFKNISKDVTISDIPFSVSFSYGEKFFFLLFSGKKKKKGGGVGPPLAKYIKLKRYRNLKIRHRASGRLICAKKESSQSSCFLMFIVNLTILKRLFAAVTKNVSFKQFYFSHLYLLQYKFKLQQESWK